MRGFDRARQFTVIGATVIAGAILLVSCTEKTGTQPYQRTIRQIMIDRGVKNRKEKIQLPDGSPMDIYTAKTAHLSLLADLPVEALVLGDLSVSNLAPIAGMKLKVLVARDTKVSDITPLTNMPLVILDILGAPVQDLGSISNLPLVHFAFSEKKVTNGMDVLRSMDSLQLINGYTPSNFWSRYDYWHPKE